MSSTLDDVSARWLIDDDDKMLRRNENSVRRFYNLAVLFCNKGLFMVLFRYQGLANGVCNVTGPNGKGRSTVTINTSLMRQIPL